MINMSKTCTNQFQPQQKSSGVYKLSANQTTGFSVGDKIRFNTLHRGNIPLGATAYTIKLSKNKKYLIMTTIQGDTTGYCQFQIYDYTNGVNLGVGQATNYSMNSTSDSYPLSSYFTEVTPATDIEMGIRISGSSGLTTLYTTSVLMIWEIDVFTIPTTYPYLVNATQVALTVTGTNWTTTRAVGLVYQTLDGAWRLLFNVYGSVSVATDNLTLTFSGIVFKNGTYQPVAAYLSGNRYYNSRVESNTSTLIIALNATSSVFGFSGDVELNAKPSII